MPFTTTDEAAISWREQGDGDVVVLLHGLGGDTGFWQTEADALARRRRVISIDARGAGDSPSSSRAFTIDDLADDVAAVLDDAGAERADVVGFSLGGLVAQAVAVRHPQRVDRLVLASTYAVMGAQALLFLDAIHDLHADGVLDEDGLYRLVLPWLFSERFLADPGNAAWLAAPGEADPARTGPAAEQARTDWCRLYRAQRTFDGRADLGLIRASTLVLAGGRDRLVPEADAALLARRIPGARHERFERAGHLINAEEPCRFLDAVEQHLAPHHRHVGPGRR